MKAAVFTGYGGPEVIKFQTVPKPIPNKNQLLIKIYATTVCTGDWRVLGPNVPNGFGCILHCAFGCTGPRINILGQEFAGIVEEIEKM